MKTPKWKTEIPAELTVNLENLEADGEEITLVLAVEEAKYILNCFKECGYSLNERLQENPTEAKKEINALKKFIKKYKKYIK